MTSKTKVLNSQERLFFLSGFLERTRIGPYQNLWLQLNVYSTTTKMNSTEMPGGNMRSSSRWILRLALQLSIISMTPNAFGNQHEDYMEYADLEAEAQVYEATNAPRVSMQEMEYAEEMLVDTESEYLQDQ
jgi:hypothetical protein